MEWLSSFRQWFKPGGIAPAPRQHDKEGALIFL
jgi:hypothetical protein